MPKSPTVGPATVEAFTVTVSGYRIFVEVFPDRRSLRQTLRQHPELEAGDTSDIEAFTQSFPPADSGHKNYHERNLALVFFNLKDLTFNHIAHECLHVSSLWADKREIPLKYRMMWIADEHECIAEFHGDLVEQLIKTLDSLKIPIHNGVTK